MSSSSFSLFCNVFGLVVGSISLLGFVAAVCRPHLPRNKIKTLESLLHETDIIFRESTEEELLFPAFVRRTNHRLTGLRAELRSLQDRVDAKAPSLLGDVLELFSETATTIRNACESVETLKAEVLRTSEERRQLRDVPRRSPPVPPPNSGVDHLPTSSPSATISRPPRAFLAYKSRDVRRMTAENDASRIDSDV